VNIKEEKDTMNWKIISAVALILMIIFAVVAVIGWTRSIQQVTNTVTVEATLEQEAMNESGLTIYSSMDVPDFQNYILPAFVRAYPWASGKVNFVGLDPATVATRAISEYQAGHVTADVLLNNLASFETVIAAGAAQSWTNPMVTLMHYPNDSYDPNDYWYPAVNLPIVIVYNTNLVNRTDAPTSWQDLANPKWDHKLIIDDPASLNVASIMFAHLYPVMGNSSWTTLMQGIHANHPTITTSASVSFQSVVSGESSVGIALINDVLSGVKSNAPIGVVWATPVVGQVAPTLILKNDPNNAMARLFCEWYCSADGQYAIASSGRPPANAAIASYTVLSGVLPSGTQVGAACSNNPSFFTNSTIWSSTFTDIFG
jgi:iron(III) transport system substrate-binding protein